MQELAVLQTPNYDLYAIKLSVVPLQVQKSSVCFNSINQDTSKKAAITVKQFLPGFYPSEIQMSCKFPLDQTIILVS